MTRVAPSTRATVRERAGGKCEYCQLPEGFSHIRHQVDHIYPPRHLGTHALDNLAFACFDCNNGKGTDIATLDADTLERVWLFNPRTQDWNDHFRMVNGQIIGQTPEGRATVRLLEMNSDEQVRIRREVKRGGRM
jgi:hypothetical protein